MSIVAVILTLAGTLCVHGVPSLPPAALKELATGNAKFSVPPKELKPQGIMPVVGLGTWQSKDNELETALESALETGYHHIDTAQVYENEKVIGKVLKKFLDSGKIKREDLFIVTKLPPGGMRPSAVKKYLDRSLKDLGLDYVDLYLIHTPFAVQDVEGNYLPMKDGKLLLDKDTDHVAIWKAMEDQVDAGKAKSIGLSNFNISQMTRVYDNARIKPSNIQVELHVYMQQKPIVEFAKKHGMVVTAYSPLGSPGSGAFFKQFGAEVTLPNILSNPVVTDIAKKHGKTEAQVLLRHAIQKGLVVIPKSTKAKRVKENFDLFSFELDAHDMKKLNDLDQGENGRIMYFTLFPGIKEHPEYPF